jgi:hypothetical protein
VLPLTSRRQIPLPLIAALAAAAALLVGLLSVSTIRLQHRVDVLHATLGGGGLQRAAAAVIFDPRHTSARLSSFDARLTALVVIGPNGDDYLVDSNLPALDELRTYQLWGLDDGQTVSLGLLGNNPNLAAFRVDSAVKRLMITAEPRGGRPQPDSRILVEAELPR